MTRTENEDPSRELVELRLRAEEFSRTKDYAGLLGMADELRGDTEQWPHLWAPACAVSAVHLDRPDEGWALLEEAVDAGFFQTDLFTVEFATTFVRDPRWPRLRARMAANVPPPPVELLSWPDPPVVMPLRQEPLPPEREELLRARLPPVTGSAWETAAALAAWVSQQWDHANDRVEEIDALHVLDRVAAGERFSCVEYSIVLTQALNAVGIPARRLALRARDYHVGIGRGHAVTEAWIDDRHRWVVLDGQNGAYWAGEDGEPLGPVEMRETFLADRPRPRMVGIAKALDDGFGDFWWQYFAGGVTAGFAWGAGPTFVPIAQENDLAAADRLVGDPASVHQELASAVVGVAGSAAEPALRFGTAHPYALGYRVVDAAGTTDVALEQGWALRREPGEHTAEIALVTGYGAFPAGVVAYRVR